MSDLARLRQILEASPVGEVLPAIAPLTLPHWWLAGGAVRNTVWRVLFGEPCGLVINDFDIAFFELPSDDALQAGFDPRAQELSAKTALSKAFPGYQFDVKNQASFGRWRQGRQIYHSTEDGVANWLHTATAVGVRVDTHGQWQFFTPYGLEDLFQGIVRPTPANRDNPDAERKGASFLQACTALRLAEDF